MNCYQNVHMETHKMLMRHLMDLFGVCVPKRVFVSKSTWKWERIQLF